MDPEIPRTRDGILRRLVRVIIRLVYRKVVVHSDVDLDTPGPVLMVANHFGGVADALLLIFVSQRRPRIMAADRIWKIKPAAWVMNSIGAIPVHQRRDGAGSNDDMFSSAYEALRDGDVVLIFPEGVTSDEPSMAKVRTGAARIALGARAAGAADLRIVPVGIHYEDKAAFRSRVFVEIGAGFGFEGVDQPEAGADDHDAVSQLTASIDQKLREAAPDYLNWREERSLLLASEVMLRTIAPDPRARVPLDLENRLANHMTRIPDERRKPVVDAGDHYAGMLDSMRLRDAVVADPASIGGLVGHTAREIVIMVLLLPYAVAGLLFNIIPIAIVAAVERLRLAPAVKATLLPFAVLVCFGLTWLVVLVAVTLADGWDATLVVSILLPFFLAALIILSERAVLAWRAVRSRPVGRRRRRASGAAEVREVLLTTTAEALGFPGATS